jgi:CheY-like chemotaxis protein
MACCADEAIDLMKAEFGNNIGWIFSDWEMPGLPAHDLVEYVHNRTDDITFVLMTGREEKNAQMLATTESVNDYISKPFSPETLINVVRRLKGLEERRRSERVTAHIPCNIDIGFDNFGVYAGDIINISQTGCLLSAPLFSHGQGYVYDVGTLSFTFNDGESIRVHSQIIRIERDKNSQASDRRIMIAFDFVNLTEEASTLLNMYIKQCGLADMHATMRSQ